MFTKPTDSERFGRIGWVAMVRIALLQSRNIETGVTISSKRWHHESPCGNKLLIRCHKEMVITNVGQDYHMRQY